MIKISTKHLFRWFITLAIGLAIWFIPVPEGLSAQAWHLLAIFVATVVGIIAKPLPMGAIALIGIIVTILTGTLGISDALSGFSNKVIWLVVTAFFISRGFIKTGLGSRIAYIFISLLGKNSLGLAYGFIATDLLLSPAIPSNTARGGGIIFPIIHSTAKTFNSDPENNSSRKIGSFLIFSSFHGLNITSAMLVRGFGRNERVYNSLSIRGFSGEILFISEKLGRRDILQVSVFFILIMSINVVF